LIGLSSLQNPLLTVEQRIDEPQEVAAVACLIDETDTEDGEVQQIKEDHKMDLYNTVQKETYRDVKINEELSEEDREKLLRYSRRISRHIF